MGNRHMRRYSTSLITGKCKSKPQRGTTPYLSEWLSSERTQITTVGEDVNRREPSYTVGGNVNLCSHCEKQYGGFTKTKNGTTV